MNQNKNTVIITGASDGIGRAIAHAFAKKGYKIGLLARRKESLEKVRDECEENGAEKVIFEVADVSAHEAFRAALAKLDEAIGGAGIFVANAGIAGETHSRKDNYDQVLKVFTVNSIAAIDGIEFFKVKMIERGGGTIAGVSSVAATRGLPGAGPYSASKAALTVYLETLKCESEDHGIRVVNVSPGFIDTAMTRRNKFHMPFLMSVEKAGEIFAKDIIAGRTLSIAPRVFYLIRWILKWAPVWAFKYIR